jgi:hypothetical protein
MLYISYQGIYDSQNFEDANTPKQIGKAFNAGYSCMVDAWRVNGQLYLGSYQPTTPVTDKYLQGVRFWINARNTEMQDWIVTQPSKLYPNYFWFPNDTESSPVTTSSGKLITPGTVAINNTSVVFLPEITDRGLLSTIHLKCYGVCSTYLTLIKRMRNEGDWY